MLGTAYPNPVRRLADVPFELERATRVQLTAYDAIRNEVIVLHNRPPAVGTGQRVDGGGGSSWSEEPVLSCWYGTIVQRGDCAPEHVVD